MLQTLASVSPNKSLRCSETSVTIHQSTRRNFAKHFTIRSKITEFVAVNFWTLFNFRIQALVKLLNSWELRPSGSLRIE